MRHVYMEECYPVQEGLSSHIFFRAFIWKKSAVPADCVKVDPTHSNTHFLLFPWDSFVHSVPEKKMARPSELRYLQSEWLSTQGVM